MTPASYRTIPDNPGGYVLANQFAVIVPVARTNLVANPSFEISLTTSTTTWAASGAGSVARVATDQYHGAYSLQVTPTSAATDGAVFSSVPLVAGSTYAVSTKIKGGKGVRYRIAVTSSGGVILASREFVGTGRWAWQWVYYTETSSASRKIIISKAAGASILPFYVDGVQCEYVPAGETVSTYIDGDQLGLVANQSPAAYYWTGTPHASTSARSANTRSGGMVMALSKYNFLLSAIIGLGLATPQNTVTEYARLDGGYPDYTRKPTRQFSLAGSLQAPSYTQLRANRAALGALLDRDLASLDQPLLLRHTLGDSEAATVAAKYSGGLEGATDNQYSQAAALSFVQYLPFVQSEREAGVELAVQASVLNANYAIYRDNGSWRPLSTGANNYVYAAVFGVQDGYLYLGGPFSSFAGTANTRGIARYDSSGTVTAMGSGGPVGGIVYGIAAGPNGHIWAGGSFASMGGAANSQGVAEWNGSAWSGPNYPGTGAPLAITVGPNGTVYTGSDTGQIYSWDGSSWTLLGTVAGSAADVYALAIGPDGSLYIGGDFTTVSAVPAVNIARYTLTASSPAWQALNGPPAGVTYRALAFAANGLLYAAGATAGGIGAAYSSNGSQFTSLGTFTGTGTIWALTVVPEGVLLGGEFATYNGVAFPDGIGLWNGGTLVPYDANLPGSAAVYALARRADGRIVVGFSTSGTAIASNSVTITNTGTARSYPTLTIHGPTSGTSRIYELLNPTTGRAIYLNYTINAGETARYVFEPDRLSFSSDFQGNLARTILPGSNESDFFLAPGSNDLVCYAADSSVTATVTWHPQFLSLDDMPQ